MYIYITVKHTKSTFHIVSYIILKDDLIVVANETKKLRLY
jgi:hypothetical protein